MTLSNIYHSGEKIFLFPVKIISSIKYYWFTQEPNKFPYQLSVVTIIKDEGDYIKEWLDYHITLGIDHFYIYDNDSKDNTTKILATYIEQGLVSYRYYPGRAKQLPAYNDAIRRYKNISKYMAFIDADEFIMPINVRDDVVNIVENIFKKDKRAGGIGINWRIFGSSGFDNKPRHGGVLDNFVYRAAPHKPGNDCIKTIANPRTIFRCNHVHLLEFIWGKHCIDENGNKIKSWSNDIDEPNLLRINHYFTKSKEEWINRRSKGKADARSIRDVRNLEEFYRHDNNDIFDDSALYFVNKSKRINTGRIE